MLERTAGRRLTTIPSKTELLDEYQDAVHEDQQLMPCTPDALLVPDQNVIGFRDDIGRRNFTLCVEGEVVFKRGSLNLIIGPTGSGMCFFCVLCKSLTLDLLMLLVSEKTSLLMALLSKQELGLCDAVILILTFVGEMHFIPLTNDSWYHLPRAGGVSYAAQESWIQNETIRVRVCGYCDLPFI